MSKPTRSLFLRILSRVLAPGRGEVRALEEAMHLQGVLRFVAWMAATIVGPSLVLAYFAVHAISVEVLAAREEISRASEDVAGALWRQVEHNFSTFEQATRNRLEAGRSPLERIGELHPMLRVALRFDAEGELIAPFSMAEPPSYPKEYLFHPLINDATALESTDPLAAAHRYGQLSRLPLPAAVRGRLELDRARMLDASGRSASALAILETLPRRYPVERDPWGFRIQDLARLLRGEILLKQQPMQGMVALQSLVTDLLAGRWTIGQGSEAAVARQALSWLEPQGMEEWAARTRGQIAERNEMLYWSGELLSEIRQIPISQLSSTPTGELRWSQGEQGLWAITRWSGDIYVFGLDLRALVDALKVDVRDTVQHGGDIDLYLLAPDDPQPSHILHRRTLDPWLRGWSVVTTLRDPEAVAAEQSRKRLQRLGLIGFAIAMMAVGAVVSARIISRELDVVRMKTDFAANVSHELRSPITQIRLKAESLLLGMAETEEEFDEHYQAILRESERLSRLVDNVLDYSAIDRGSKQYMLRPNNLAETVERALEGVRTSLEVRDMELDINVPYDLPVVKHDPDAITQCLVNLISNAAKYSGEGGWIGILGRVVEGGVELAISDHGIGIAPHDLRRIFEPFYRSRDAMARRRKGTGIGLTITKYIMEAHGGSVSVQSRPGKGSTFTLRFPI